MAAEPVVSTVIPVRDGERHLGAAIESVLAQTRPPDEVIVIDDGSSDRSREVAQRYAPAVRCISQPGAGPAEARNRGVSMASGDHLAFLDADDLWEPRKLELQLEALRAEPSAGLVFGQVAEFHSPELDAAAIARMRRPRERRPGQHIGAMLATREAWDVVGPLATTWRVGEFLDWCLRADEAGVRSAKLFALVLRRRLRRDSRVQANRHAMGDYARMIKASLDRRRGVAG